MRNPAMLLRATVFATFLAACSSDAPTPTAVVPAQSAPQSAVLPGSGTWTTGAPIPTNDAYRTGAALGGRFYVSGGNNAGTLVERYDPTANSWDTVAYMPDNSSGHSMVASHGLLWVFGGGYASNTSQPKTLWVYSPLSNTWKTKAPMPHGRKLGAAAVVDGLIYAIGGVDINYNGIADVDRYDPASDTWTTVAPLPTGLVQCSAAVLDRHIYVVGGQSLAGNNLLIYVYDPDLNSWQTLTPTNPPDYAIMPSLGVVGGVLYVAFGFGSAAALAYDATHNAWIALATPPVSPQTWGRAYGVIGKSIYYAAGNTFPTNELDVFTPGSPGNHKPVAVIGGPYSGVEGSGINFTGTGSSDPDGDVITYAWDFGDGNTSTDQAPSHAYASYGNFSVKLTVTDPSAASSSATATAHVGNVAPVIAALTRDTVWLGESLEQDGSFTDPGSGDPFSATVDFGDGGGAQTLHLTATNFHLSHGYTTSGGPLVTVTVSDGAATRAASVHVRVLSPSEALGQVLAFINGLGLADSVKHALKAPLLAARASALASDYSAAYTHVGDFQTAITALTGAGLTLTQAAQLTTAANRLKSAILAAGP